MGTSDSGSSLVPAGRFEWEQLYRRALVTPPSVKLLGYTLATYADTKTGGRIHPGIQRLALATGQSDRQVRRGLKALEDLDLVRCGVRGSQFGRGGKGLASRYQLTIPADLIERVEVVDFSVLDQGTPVSGDTEEDRTPTSSDLPEQGTPVSRDLQEQGTPRVRTEDTTGLSEDNQRTSEDTGVLLPLHELSPHESSPHQSSAAASSTTLSSPVGNFRASDDENLSFEERRNNQLAALRVRYADDLDSTATETIEGQIVNGDQPTDAFGRFWHAFPSDRKANKTGCRAKFDKAVKSGVDPEHIITAAQAYRDDPNRLSAYTVAPHRWLNEERWDAGPLPGRPPESATDRKLAVATDRAKRLANYQRKPDPFNPLWDKPSVPSSYEWAQPSNNDPEEEKRRYEERFLRPATGTDAPF